MLGKYKLQAKKMRQLRRNTQIPRETQITKTDSRREKKIQIH